MKHTIIFISLIFLIPLHSVAEDNYCLDQKSWKQWENLIEKAPGDMDIQALHALRLGLCAKVERGDITVQQATDIFESARDAIISKKKSIARREKDNL
ncbi:hypothetical protein ACFL7M_07950 [Thermodesulfobacteriota bacterium]